MFFAGEIEYLMDTATLSEDLAFLVRLRLGLIRLATDIVDNSKAMNIDKRTADYFTGLPAHVLRTIYEFYKLDFILFGYDVPPYIQDVL